MIFVTGDCHADFKKFSVRNFQEQRCLTHDDFVIVCGDFGIWHDTSEERHWLDWLSNKPFTTLFVDGNHENFDRLYGDEFEVVDFHGGKAHKIREHIYHLMRGHIFDLCDKTFFAFGGASSHDIKDGILDENDFPSYRAFMNKYDQMWRARKMFRVNHMSWWAQELPSDEEINFARANLKDHGDMVDYIVTHDCPAYVAATLYNGDNTVDKLNTFLNDVAYRTTFKEWFFGHHHHDMQVLDKYLMLYDKIVRIV